MEKMKQRDQILVIYQVIKKRNKNIHKWKITQIQFKRMIKKVKIQNQ